MKNPSNEILTTAANMKDEGVATAQILAETGLNYSQFWLFWARRHLEANNPELICRLEPTDPKIPGLIVEARNVEGEFSSWGWLSVRFGMPESRVRKTFEQKANIHSDGLRIGKGGRFVEDRGEYYVDENRKHGVVTPVGERHKVPGRSDEALAEKLAGMRVGQINALLKAAGLPATGKKADKIVRLIANRNATEKANA